MLEIGKDTKPRHETHIMRLLSSKYMSTDIAFEKGSLHDSWQKGSRAKLGWQGKSGGPQKKWRDAILIDLTLPSWTEVACWIYLWLPYMSTYIIWHWIYHLTLPYLGPTPRWTQSWLIWHSHLIRRSLVGFIFKYLIRHFVSCDTKFSILYHLILVRLPDVRLIIIS